MNYIETQASKFWEAMNEQVINTLFKVLNEAISLDKLIDEANEKTIAEDKSVLESQVKDWLITQEEADKSNWPRLINKNDKLECFNFWFQYLLSTWRTMLHDLDDNWNLIVKIFEIIETRNFKIKPSYSVTIA